MFPRAHCLFFINNDEEIVCRRGVGRRELDQKRIWGSILNNIFRLAGGAHRPLPHAFEFFSTFIAFVVLAFYPVGRDLQIDRASDSAHRTITSLECITGNHIKHMQPGGMERGEWSEKAGFIALSFLMIRNPVCRSGLSYSSGHRPVACCTGSLIKEMGFIVP